MKKILFFSCLFTFVCSLTAVAQASYDLQSPFGFAACNSRTTTGTYNMTGGGGWIYNEATGAVTNTHGVTATDVVVLSSTGSDMKKTIQNTIKDHAVVVFDGAGGDFLVSSTISLSNLSGKTLLGIHGARLCTQWHVTPQITAALDTVTCPDGQIGVKNASTISGGGRLPNGQSVNEDGEYLTRRTIMSLTGDQSESYRSSGIFSFSGCSNFIIRNLAFVGPGSVDVSGSDLISFGSATNHMWVDHCDFTDGMDGNFDITKRSDFNTVSWCTFSYTDYSYDHQNTNLIGSSDSETTGYLNTTFAHCVWGTGCRQRMPMARVGKIHLMNNYYNCPDAIPAVNPRKNSEFLIEGNVFAEEVVNVFAESQSTAYEWRNTNRVLNPDALVPTSSGTVSLPYTYTLQSADSVPVINPRHAGATLYNGTTPTPPPAVDPDTIPTVDPDTIPAPQPVVTGDSLVWDFHEYSSERVRYETETAYLSSDPALTEMKIMVGTNENDYITNGGFRANGRSSTTSRYMKYTPLVDGTMVVRFKSNNSGDAPNRFSAIGTEIVVGESVTAATPGILSLASAAEGRLSATLETGTTYYIFWVLAGQTITRVAYYSTPEPESDPVTDICQKKESPADTTPCKILLNGRLLIRYGDRLFDPLGR